MLGGKLHAIIRTPGREFQLHVVPVKQLQGRCCSLRIIGLSSLVSGGPRTRV